MLNSHGTEHPYKTLLYEVKYESNILLFIAHGGNNIFFQDKSNGVVCVCKKCFVMVILKSEQD